MRLVDPFAVTDATLTTNATETVSAWTTGSYSAGQQATYKHRVWEARRNNTNKPPDLNPLDWWDVRPTNPWAMFDDRMGTQTTRADDLAVAIGVAGYANTLGLLNISAATLNVIVEDGGVEVMNEDIPLVDESAVTDWYSYFFEPIVRKTDVVIPLPPDRYNPTVKVELTDAGETVAVGTLVVGQSKWIGDAQYGAQIGFQDKSQIVEDVLKDETYILRRGVKRYGRFVNWVPESQRQAIQNIVASYHAMPILIVATDSVNADLFYGLLGNAVIELGFPTHSLMTVEVRSL